MPIPVKRRFTLLFLAGLMATLTMVACLPEGDEATRVSEDATRETEDQTKEAEKALDEKKKEFEDLPNCKAARDDVYVVSSKNPGRTEGSPIRKIENYSTLDVVIKEDWARIDCTGEAELKNGKNIGRITYWSKKYKGDRTGTREAGFY